MLCLVAICKSLPTTLLHGRWQLLLSTSLAVAVATILNRLTLYMKRLLNPAVDLIVEQAASHREGHLHRAFQGRYQG